MNQTLIDAQYCVTNPDVLHTPAQHREIITGLLTLVARSGDALSALTDPSGHIPHGASGDCTGECKDARAVLSEIEAPPMRKCCVCGTTEGVRWMGGSHPWLCASPDCIPF